MGKDGASSVLAGTPSRGSSSRDSLASKRQRLIVVAAFAFLVLCTIATGLALRVGRGETEHRLSALAREQAALFRERLHTHGEVLHGLATTGERGSLAARRDIRISERFPAFRSLALVHSTGGEAPSILSSLPDAEDMRTRWRATLDGAGWRQALNRGASTRDLQSVVALGEAQEATLGLVAAGGPGTGLFAAGDLSLEALLAKPPAGSPRCQLIDGGLHEAGAGVGAVLGHEGEKNASAPHRSEHAFQAAGRQWSMVVSAGPEFATAAERWLPIGVASGTLLASALLLLLFHRLLRELEGSERLACELRDQNAAAQDRALRDPLTGLANRALFLERLAAALTRLEREPQRIVAVLFLDLDGFKDVNDALGHARGDELLLQVACRLRELVRDHDAVARLGGDEFTVLAEEIGEPTEALHLAQRVQAALDLPFRFGGHEVRVGASVGISISDSRRCDAAALLREADAAMYDAKRQGGRGVCVFDMAARDELRARVQLERSLPEAIRCGQLAVVYQPVLRLRDGSVAGLEALLRWSGPETDTVSPQVFVAIADSLGLASELLRFVLTRSAELRPKLATFFGPEVRVWVNLLPRHLAHGCALDVVEELSTAGHLDPKFLGLEVGTTVPLDESAGVLPAMRRLRELGVHFAVDDFGTGPTSISSLRRLPVDALKIDPSFIGRLGQADDDAMVAGIIRLAGGLGLASVAEGVETREQAETLLAMGCSHAQGHYLCPPLPPAELERAMQDAGTLFGERAAGWS